MPFDESLLPKTREEYEKLVRSQIPKKHIKAFEKTEESRDLFKTLMDSQWSQFEIQRLILEGLKREQEIKATTPEDLDKWEKENRASVVNDLRKDDHGNQD